MQTKLTLAQVSKLLKSPPPKDRSWFDNEVPRFALRVKPSGAANFFIRYTGPDTGRETRMKVGDPRTMSLDEARKEARRLLGRVDGGRDPRLERTRRRAEWSVRQLARSYLESETFLAKTKRTRATDYSRINRHILPNIGNQKIGDIDAAVARRLYERTRKSQRTLKDGGPGRKRLGGAGTARKSVRLLSAMLTWAVEQGEIKNHPFKGELRLPGDGTRDAILASPEEYGRLFEKMDEMAKAGTIRPKVRDAIVVIAATGLRRSELQNLRWRQVDLANRRITLRGDEHKGGRLVRQPPDGTNSHHRFIDLVPLVAETISRQGNGDDDPEGLVFAPDNTNAERINLDHEWRRIRTEANLPEGFTLHSFRHSLGSAAALGGLTQFELMKVLGHRQPTTTARYVKWAENQQRVGDRAAQAALGHLAAGTQEKEWSEPMKLRRDK